MKSKRRITGLRLQSLVLFSLLLATAFPAIAQRQEPTENDIESGETALNTSAENRRLGDLVSIVSPKVGSTIETAPVQLTVRLGTGVHPANFHARLNGQEITGKFARVNNTACLISACDLVAEVSPDDGLVKGLNELVVEARNGSGKQTARQKFVVTGPRADAGPDHRLRAGKAVQLDGTKSVIAGSKPSYRWELVDRPQGSGSVINDQNSAMPTIVPDVNGVYEVRLVVRDGYFNSEPDTVRISAAPASLPGLTSATLVQLQTRVVTGDGSVANDYGIGLGDKVYTPTTGNIPADLTGVQVLVIDRTTAAPATQADSDQLDFQPNRAFATASKQGINDLKDYLNKLHLGVLVVLSVYKKSGPNNKEIGEALQAFGANSEIEGLGADLVYSFVGVKGSKYDQAYQTGGPINVTLTLAPDAYDNYAVTQIDYVPFTAQNYRITIGGTAYDFQGYPSGPAGCGFRVLALDRYSLSVQLDQGYETNTSSGDNGLSEINRMVNDLNGLLSRTAESSLVFIQSLNNASCGPLSGDPDVRKTGLPGLINRLGGNPYVVSQMFYKDNYMLVGALSPGYKNALPFAALEASSVITPDPDNPDNFPSGVYPAGAVRGMLGRGRRGAWYAPIASDFDLALPINYELYSVAWQTPTPWPLAELESCDGTPVTPDGLQAAYDYIGQKLCNCSPREHYDDDPPPFTNWLSVFDNELSKYPGGNVNFTESEFCAVRTQVLQEVRYANDINGLYQKMNGILTDAIAKDSGTIHTIVQELEKATSPKPTSPVVINILKLLGGVAAVGSAAAPASSAAVKGALGVLSAAFNTAASLASTSAGGIQQQIESTAGQVETDSQAAFTDIQHGLARIFEQITSDWGRMNFVGSRLHNEDPVWRGTIDNTDKVKTGFSLAMRRHYYERLLPVVYRMNELVLTFPGQSGSPGCSSNVFFNYTPSSWLSYPSIDPSTLGWFDHFYITRSSGSFTSDFLDAPPQSLTDKIFQTTVENPDGLVVPKIEFFVKWPFNHVKCN